MCDLRSGIYLKTQIEDMIRRADVFISDISGNNLNVIFELGAAYSISFTKPTSVGILMRDDLKITDAPSDISGIFIEKYNPKYFYKYFQVS